mmetsp:Transcript_29066/g.73049  ORF Transcript_29066/g.73049 Transcript_29066/m.73049 type:complete len:109 (-) Transcript_29066:252-578(-)
MRLFTSFRTSGAKAAIFPKCFEASVPNLLIGLSSLVLSAVAWCRICDSGIVSSELRNDVRNSSMRLATSGGGSLRLSTRTTKESVGMDTGHKLVSQEDEQQSSGHNSS